ncbi:MAG: ECF transporter S component [Oscillospiraceae bacterium]|nr:ECF transporter S component [Oscillospiraceae bacterium]
MSQENRKNQRAAANVKSLTGISILCAIVVVLTILCTFIRFGPFSITLALAPIIIGAALYGKKAGAILGFVFGLVVLITGLLSLDGGAVMLLFSQNALATVALCLVKGTMAGLLAGAVYGSLAKKSLRSAVLAAGIVCPVVNTGLFLAGMLLFFFSTLSTWANGTNLLNYMLVGLTGVNFLIELAVNLLLSTMIVRIIQIEKKGNT